MERTRKQPRRSNSGGKPGLRFSSCGFRDGALRRPAAAKPVALNRWQNTGAPLEMPEYRYDQKGRSTPSALREAELPTARRRSGEEENSRGISRRCSGSPWTSPGDGHWPARRRSAWPWSKTEGQGYIVYLGTLIGPDAAR